MVKLQPKKGAKITCSVCVLLVCINVVQKVKIYCNQVNTISLAQNMHNIKLLYPAHFQFLKNLQRAFPEKVRKENS